MVMNTMAFVVMIVLIACTTSVIMEYLKTQQKKNKKEADAEAGDMASQMDALEERIRVLERIVTENKFDLKREIDRL